ncbi:hypothetical protein ACU635_26555 [[Actinomadura] parvosata]|uniref:hypothetical protein n=1 Tax=[Actinomadura] parvosata TaxID=1955412 RepID=UPI00406C992D
MSQPPPFVIDPAGAGRHAEYAALRARGPATPVDVLGLRAWAVSDPALLKSMLTAYGADHRRLRRMIAPPSVPGASPSCGRPCGPWSASWWTSRPRCPPAARSPPRRPRPTPRGSSRPPTS